MSTTMPTSIELFKSLALADIDVSLLHTFLQVWRCA